MDTIFSVSRVLHDGWSSAQEDDAKPEVASRKWKVALTDFGASLVDAASLPVSHAKNMGLICIPVSILSSTNWLSLSSGPIILSQYALKPCLHASSLACISKQGGVSPLESFGSEET